MPRIKSTAPRRRNRTNAQRAASAAEILSIRRSARRSLDDWARVNGYEPARHHRYMNRKLEAVVRGDIKRLMIWMPPGHAKSTYTSMLLPAWFFHHHPQGQILAISHKDKLVKKWGRICRNRVRAFAGTLGFTLAQDQKAADQWEITTGGDYYGCGITATPSGRRADLILLDDPVSGREAADSELQRDKLLDIYREEVYTRLKPDGAIIIIQTRWHPFDLSGQLLQVAKDGGEQWEVLNLPAIADYDDPLGREVGEALWPEWMDTEKLAEVRLSVGERGWNALYQQKPRPDEGAVWKEAYLRYFDFGPGEVPRRDGATIGPSGEGLPTTEVWSLYRFATADLALGKKDGDYTVICVWGYDRKTGLLYLMKMDRGRYGSPATKRLLRKYHDEWRLDALFIEGTQYQTAVVQDLKEEQIPAKEVIPDRDKKTRLLAAEPWGEQRRILFSRTAHNTPYLVGELLSFMGTGDEVDDCVDNISMATMVAKNAYGDRSKPYIPQGDRNGARQPSAHQPAGNLGTLYGR